MTILRFFQISKNKCRQVERTGKMTTTTTRGRGKTGPESALQEKTGPASQKRAWRQRAGTRACRQERGKRRFLNWIWRRAGLKIKKNSNIYSFGIGNNQSFNRAPSPLTVINNDKHIFLKNQITDHCRNNALVFQIECTNQHSKIMRQYLKKRIYDHHLHSNPS